jgi:hypothetical protein
MASLPAAKLIRDIRYYESDQPNLAGLSLPEEPGRIFEFAVDVVAVGQRIARKLRERGFVTGPFDHVYVNFTPLLPDHDARWSDRKVEPWLRYVDYGLSPTLVGGLPAGACEALVADATFRALEALVARDPDEMAKLAVVRSELATHGSEIEILLLTKKTKRHRITISYQIRPHGRDSVGWIEYEDLRTNERAKAPFVRLFFLDDIYPLVGAVAVNGDAITLKPRTSFKASLYNEHYAHPIEVSIPKLLSGVPLLPRT